jgi:ketol-acid reductoisomerase
LRIYIAGVKSADLSGRKVAVIGYGSQGCAIAMNLRDSGHIVTVGLPPASKSRRKAKRDGFKSVRSVADAVKQAEIVCFAFPDHLHGRVYQKEIAKNLSGGSCLLFLHGLSVHFGFVPPPRDADVVLVAPHGPGPAVREKYLSDRSMSAFVAVHQDATGHARKTALRLAEDMGFRKKKLIETSFENEALGDLFGEQVVLCGGLTALIKGGFETLVANGLPPDDAYLEVAYQLDLIIALIKKYGIAGMFERISVAARYGSLVTGPKIIDAAVKRKMAAAFDEIKSGKFTTQLNRLTKSDITRLNKALTQLSHPEFEKAARKFSK